MDDKECLWNQHDNIPPNGIGIFENDQMYEQLFSMPNPSAKTFGYGIEWGMLRLTYGFPIAQYPLCRVVANIRTLILHPQMTIKIAKTDNYNSTEPRYQIVQIQGQSVEPKYCRGLLPKTSSRQSAGVPLISWMQPIRVP